MGLSIFHVKNWKLSLHNREKSQNTCFAFPWKKVTTKSIMNMWSRYAIDTLFKHIFSIFPLKSPRGTVSHFGGSFKRSKKQKNRKRFIFRINYGIEYWVYKEHDPFLDGFPPLFYTKGGWLWFCIPCLVFGSIFAFFSFFQFAL